MNQLVMLCLCAVLGQLLLMSQAAVGADQVVQAKEGTLLYSQDGRRLGTVYKVGEDGSVKLIFNNKLVVIPASTLADAKGKLTTTLTKTDVYGLAQQSASQ
jgi:hypothetical protein